jgi:hypothetical protein|nr:MAG TPA: hypothetical protein [Caudoviricetes sp.]
MTQEDYKRATNLLEQIDKLDTLSNKIGVEYRNTTNEDLREVLTKCNEALTVLKEINQEKFDKL